MLAKAPYRESLPQARYQRQSEKTQTRARAAARRRALADKRLTGGCARFYCLLDEEYGWRDGLVCPKLETLEKRFGLCRRSCQRWYAQLREYGYLVTEPRNGRACRHRLSWAQNDTTEATGVSHRISLCKTDDSKTQADAVTPATPEPAEVEPGETSGPCPDCHDTGTREYWMPAERGTYGMRPERRWRGRCGCQMVIRRQ